MKAVGVGVAAKTQRLMTVFHCTLRFPNMETLVLVLTLLIIVRLADDADDG